MIPAFRTLLVSRPVLGAARTMPAGRLQMFARHKASSSTSHDEDDRMIGPYPHVKFEYYNERPQDVKYDDQQGRRNLGEPLHYKFDHIDVWSPDHFDARPNTTALKWNIFFLGIIFGFSTWCWYVFDGPNFVRREYPHNGLQNALGTENNQARVDEAAK